MGVPHRSTASMSVDLAATTIVAAVVGDEELLDGAADLAESSGATPAAAASPSIEPQVERRDPAVVVADDHLEAARIDREGADAGRRDRRDEGPGRRS